MSQFKDQIRHELGKVRQETDAALAKAGGDLKAGAIAAARAAMDHALVALPGDLKILRAHGFTVEGGAYFLGSQLAAFAFQGINPMDALHHPLMGPLLHEYTQKAGKL